MTRNLFRGIALALAAPLLLMLLLFGRGTFSYLSTGLNEVREAVKESVPLEFELERARNMITELGPEIGRNTRLIAQEEVRVESLRKQLEERGAGLAQQQGDILRLKTDLDSGRDSFHYGDRTYTVAQVKNDLAARFARYKLEQSTQDQFRQILEARERGLAAARRKLEGMLAARKQLEVDVENLQARLKMVEVAETTSELQFNDSRLARTRELIGEIGLRIEVAEKLVSASSESAGEIRLEDPAVENVSEEIARYFSEPSPLAASGTR